MAKPLAMSGAVSNLIKPSATSTGHANPRRYHRAHAPRDDRSNTPTWNRVSNSSSSRVIASTGVASTKMMLAEYSDQMNTGRRYQARSAQSVNGDDEILSRPTTLASVFCAPSLEEIIVTVEPTGCASFCIGRSKIIRGLKWRRTAPGQNRWKTDMGDRAITVHHRVCPADQLVDEMQVIGKSSRWTR
jgi:hypothetical protein